MYEILVKGIDGCEDLFYSNEHPNFGTIDCFIRIESVNKGTVLINNCMVKYITVKKVDSQNGSSNS